MTNETTLLSFCDATNPNASPLPPINNKVITTMVGDGKTIVIRCIGLFKDNYLTNSDFQIQTSNPNSKITISVGSVIKSVSTQITVNNAKVTAYEYYRDVTITFPRSSGATNDIVKIIAIQKTECFYWNADKCYVHAFYHNSNKGITSKTPAKIALGNNILSEELPIGTIVMFYSSNVNKLPDNWVICNGQNGTPNLVNRIVVGSGNYDFGYGGSRRIEDDVFLNESMIPNHYHKFRYQYKVPRLKGEDRQDNQSGNLKNHGVSTKDYVSDNSEISTDTYTVDSVTRYSRNENGLNPIYAPYYQRLIFIMKIK